MVSTEIIYLDRNKKYKTEYIAGENQKIVVYNQSGTDLSMTLHDKLVIGNTPTHDLRVGEQVTIYGNSYDYANPTGNGITETLTVYQSQWDYDKTRPYYNLKKRSSATAFSTSQDDFTSEVSLHTQQSQTTGAGYHLYGTSYKNTAVTGISFLYDNNTTGYIIFLQETQPRRGLANDYNFTEVTSSASPYYNSSGTTSITNAGENNNTNYNTFISPLEINQHTFGHFDTAYPAIQDGLGTSATLYANQGGMLLPVIGANLGTGRFNNGGLQSNHQGYTPNTLSPVEVGTGLHLYTAGSWYQDPSYNWSFVTELRTRTTLRTDTNFSYHSTLPLDSVKQAFLLGLTTYKFSNSTDLEDSTQSFWQQNTNSITAVTLDTSDGKYVLGSVEYATDTQEWVSTSYTMEATMKPLITVIDRTEFRGSNNEALRWFSANDKFNDKVFVCGGIDPLGQPKTAYVYHQDAPNEYKSLTFRDTNGTMTTALPVTGERYVGTDVTTLIYRDNYQVSVADVSLDVLPINQGWFTAFYKQLETAWTNSRIILHPWDIPIGGSYGEGIVTLLGEAPTTSISTLNPTAKPSEYRTAKVYGQGVLPQTTHSEYYLSTNFYHTQSDAPFIN
jgi:hypothetical protein